jgi:hypothetical protein
VLEVIELQNEEKQEAPKTKNRPSKKFKQAEQMPVATDSDVILVESESDLAERKPAATSQEAATAAAASITTVEKKKKKLGKQKTNKLAETAVEETTAAAEPATTTAAVAATNSELDQNKTLTASNQKSAVKKYKSTLKTPSSKRISSLKILHSTIKKSIKPKRPLTRRAVAAEKAAAEAAAAKLAAATVATTTAVSASSSSSSCIIIPTTSGLAKPSVSSSSELTKASGNSEIKVPATPSSSNFKHGNFIKNTLSKIRVTSRFSLKVFTTHLGLKLP